MTVALPGREYNIQIGWGLLTRVEGEFRTVLFGALRIFVVTDNHVVPLYLEWVHASLEGTEFQVIAHTVSAGESFKRAAHLVELQEAMMAVGLTRTDAVATLGGSVVGDLAGFAAAAILWGAGFMQTPTTLPAQVDSFVGGKVAVDLEHGKNLAGAFWQSRLVFMDLEMLDILPLPVFMEGMAEVVKYGCIRDTIFFDFLATWPSRAELMAEVEYILYTCCAIKRSVVEQNERDTGERILLNFGHTLGYTYELAGHYTEWSHGAAVAVGMYVIARLGVHLGVTLAELPERLEEVFSALGLSAAIPRTAEDYVAAVGLDKRGVGEDTSVTLLERMGRAVPHRTLKAQLLEGL